jgi:hypothetical protein
MSPRGSREDVSNSARHCFCHTNLCARLSVVGRVLTPTGNEGDDVATALLELRWPQTPWWLSWHRTPPAKPDQTPEALSGNQVARSKKAIIEYIPDNQGCHVAKHTRCRWRSRIASPSIAMSGFFVPNCQEFADLVRKPIHLGVWTCRVFVERGY